MKPPPFGYARASSVDEAVSLLAADEDAKVIAGGQSLVPMLNFRQVRPSKLVDITGIAGLDGIEREGDELVIRATVRQSVAEHSPVVRRDCPLVGQALQHVGHVLNRARGTVCGSLAHADPAAELAAVAVALDAVLVAVGPSGERRIPAAEFYLGPHSTALDRDELLIAVRFPVTPSMRTAFVEYARRPGDLAEAGVACAVTLGSDGTVTAARLACMGVAARPVRLRAAERQLMGRRPSEAATAAAADAVALEPHGPAGHADPYKTQLVRTLVRRALRQATR
jgi:CO/xanthine dehydrogenase FAD-binding subunit